MMWDGGVEGTRMAKRKGARRLLSRCRRSTRAKSRNREKQAGTCPAPIKIKDKYGTGDLGVSEPRAICGVQGAGHGPEEEEDHRERRPQYVQCPQTCFLSKDTAVRLKGGPLEA